MKTEETQRFVPITNGKELALLWSMERGKPTVKLVVWRKAESTGERAQRLHPELLLIKYNLPPAVASPICFMPEVNGFPPTAHSALGLSTEAAGKQCHKRCQW